MWKSVKDVQSVDISGLPYQVPGLGRFFVKYGLYVLRRGYTCEMIDIITGNQRPLKQTMCVAVKLVVFEGRRARRQQNHRLKADLQKTRIMVKTYMRSIPVQRLIHVIDI